MPLLDELKQKRTAIYGIVEPYGVTNIRVFGSVARGEEDETSDIDLLADMPDEGFGLWDIVMVQDEIESLMGRPVELLDPREIRYKTLRDYIFKDAVPL